MRAFGLRDGAYTPGPNVFERIHVYQRDRRPGVSF